MIVRRRHTDGNGAKLSPLALDLAFSDVNTAAIKVRLGQQIADQERRSAAKLRTYFVRFRNRLKYSESSTEESIVPEASMRRMLEQTFNRLTQLNPPKTRVPQEKIDRLVEILSKVVEAEQLDDRESIELLGILQSSERKQITLSDLPKLEHLQR